jgi:hypothetical protein
VCWGGYCWLDEIETRVGSRLADPRISLVYLIMAPGYRADRSAARSAAQPHTSSRRNKGRNADNGKA